MANEAPNRMSVVADVIKAHPEIDTLDEDSLDKGRAAIVDWTAQRLNKAEGRIVWGRKSRGRPNGHQAVNPNTDGLTYLRSDGRFEIIDVIVGATGAANWENYGPFNPGENGWWAPPQLGPENGSAQPVPVPAPPPVPQPPAPPPVDLEPLRKEIAALRELVTLLAQAISRNESAITALENRKYRVVGQTGRSYGHAHSLDVRLEPLP